MCVYCLKCTKFGKLFVRKVIKTVATRSLDYSLKHPKMRLAAGLCPDPLGELNCLSAPPDPLAAKGGLLLRGGGGEGRDGGDGREKGGEGRDFAGPIKIWLLRPCKVSKAFERSTKTPIENWLGCVVLFIG